MESAPLTLMLLQKKKSQKKLQRQLTLNESEWTKFGGTLDDNKERVVWLQNTHITYVVHHINSHLLNWTISHYNATLVFIQFPRFQQWEKSI